ncbi:hypothetical protein ACWKSP_29765 [Micromonosporaceae bacterium Da 78-11]
MRTPRLAGLSLATMATVAFAAAGCDNGGATPGASAPAPTTTASATSSAAPADPAAVSALSNATAQLGTTSFKLTATSGSGFKLTGAIDAPKGLGTAELVASGPNAEINIKSRLIAQDLYVQIPGITKAGTWTHLDGARLPAGANIGLRPGQIDPVNTANLIGSTTDAHSTGANSYAGTLDVSKALGLAGLNQVTIDGYGSTAQNVPFTAGMDEQGRLSVLTINLPAVGTQQAQPIEVLYTDYGTPVDAPRPATSEITEAPADLYKTFGN